MAERLDEVSSAATEAMRTAASLKQDLSQHEERIKADILRVERDSDAALKLHSTDIRHVVDKVEEQISKERMQADAKLHIFAQRMEQQDHHATQLVKNTEVALQNELRNT